MEPPVLAADVSFAREEFSRVWLDALRRDGVLLGVAGAYVVGVGLLCLALGKTGFFHPFAEAR